jgi:integrase
MAVKKLPNGMYVADWRDKDGNRYRPQFATKHEADAVYEEMRSAVRMGKFIPPKERVPAPTFAKIEAAWIATRADRRAAVLDNYRRCMDRYFLPRLGQLPIDKIDAQKIESVRAELRQTLAVSTVRSVMAILSTLFKYAVRHGDLSVNPMVNVERMHTGAEEITDDGDRERDSGDAVRPEDVFNANENRRLIAAATPGRYRTFIATAAGTGARSGELAALSWDNVDLDGGFIHIRQTLSWAKGTEESLRARFYPPKTKAGIRSIPIPPALVTMLKEWKLRCPPGELVFPAKDGRPLRRVTMYHLGLVPALKRAGLRHLKLHSLRHSYASLLIAEGCPITEVQRLLGHANPAITLRVYSHFLKGHESGAVEKVAEALFGSWTPGGHQAGGGIKSA